MFKKLLISILLMFLLFFSNPVIKTSKFENSLKDNIITSNLLEAKTELTNESEIIILKLQIGSNIMYVNDSPITIDVAPIIVEGRTLLPIRWIAEPLGARVDWDNIDKKVTITLNEIVIELWIGKNLGKVNGNYKMIDPNNPKVVPLIINGRTMLPIRFVSENLGCQVLWDNVNRLVTISFINPFYRNSSIQKIITPYKNEIIEYKNKLKIEIDKNTFDQETLISIIEKPNYSIHKNNLKLSESIFEIKSSSNNFNKKIKLSFVIPNYFVEPNILHWDDEFKCWDIFDGYIENQYIYCFIDSFSDYTLGEIETVWSSDYNPIKYGFHFKNLGVPGIDEGGICSGMCISSLKLYENKMDAPLICDFGYLNDEWKYFIKKAHEAGNTLQKRIERELNRILEKQSTVLSKIIQNNNKPLLLITEFIGTQEDGTFKKGYHALIAYKLEKISKEKYILYVYDPNYAPHTICSVNDFNNRSLYYPIVLINKNKNGKLTFNAELYKFNDNGELEVFEKDSKYHYTFFTIIEEINFNLKPPLQNTICKPLYDFKFNTKPENFICQDEYITCNIFFKNIMNNLTINLTIYINFDKNEIFNFDYNSNREIDVAKMPHPNSIILTGVIFHIINIKPEEEIKINFKFKVDKNSLKGEDFNIIVKLDFSKFCDYSEVFKKTLLIKKADLIVKSISWEPQNPENGDFVIIKAHIKNIGDIVAKNFKIKLEIEGSTHDIVNVESLDPSEDYKEIIFKKFKFNFENIKCLGIVIFIDSENEITEINENNNRKVENICTKTKADLTIEPNSISCSPEKPKEGDSVIIKAKIKNQGGDIAKNFYTKLEIEGIQYDILSTSFLAPSSSIEISFKPWKATSGCKDIRVTVDSGNNVEESNEGNNILTREICVESKKPDLIVESISYSPSSPKEGDSVTISAKIKNQGEAIANNFSTRLEIGGVTHDTKLTSSLSPGSSTTITFSSWKATSGCKDIRVTVDSGNNVEESNEGNNVYYENLCVNTSTESGCETIFFDDFVSDITNKWDSGSLIKYEKDFSDGNPSPCLKLISSGESYLHDYLYPKLSKVKFSDKILNTIVDFDFKIGDQSNSDFKMAFTCINKFYLFIYSKNYENKLRIDISENNIVSPKFEKKIDNKWYNIKLKLIRKSTLLNYTEFDLVLYLNNNFEFIYTIKINSDYVNGNCSGIAISGSNGFKIDNFKVIRCFGDSQNQNISADIWVDRGCGSTYYVGESGKVYFKSNLNSYVEIYWSTNGSTPQLIKKGNVEANKTYYFDFSIIPPVGTEVVSIKAISGSLVAEKSCIFYSKEKTTSGDCFALFNFEEGSGTITRDDFSGYIGKLYGNVTFDKYIKKHDNYSLKFGGSTNDYVETNITIPDGNFYFEAWIYPTDLSGNNIYRPIITNWTNTMGTIWFGLVGNRLYLQIQDWGYAGYDANIIINTNEWTKVGFQYQTGMVEIYVNDILVFSKTDTKPIVSNKTLRLGAYSYGSLASGFKGNIDVVLICKNKPKGLVVYKPNIYLYPEVDEIINVKLKTIFNIIESEPIYNEEGWTVYVNKEGIINNYYNYLFYEALIKDIFLNNTEFGWIIKKDEFTYKIKGILNDIGFNQREIDDFIEYWSLNLPNSNYYLFTILDESVINKLIKLEINPIPHMIRRIWFGVKMLNEPISVKEPEFLKIERIGFTVIEWGLYFIDD